MDKPLKTTIDQIRKKAVMLEDSEFAHLFKQDAIGLYHDIADGFQRLHDLITQHVDRVDVHVQPPK